MSSVRHPPYRIATKRLVIRCWNPDDAPRLSEALAESRDELLPWLPWAADEPRPLDDRVELLRSFRGRFDLGEDFTYGIFDPKERSVLGGTGLHTRAGPDALEIGYWIRTGRTGRGLATEAAAALTRVCFELLGLDRVEIRAEPGNDASLAIPAKLGFAREGMLRRRLPGGDGTKRDVVVCSLFAAEYPGSPASKVRLRAWDAAAREMDVPPSRTPRRPARPRQRRPRARGASRSTPPRVP